jgi:hypothetical protein
MSDKCKEELRDFISTLKALTDTVQLYDINKISTQPASSYLGATIGGSLTLGQWFDSQGHRGQGATAATGVPQSGIYFRDVSTFIGDRLYMFLHEMMHIAYPVPVNGSLDEGLARHLGISRREGETWSRSVSRFFNSKCTEKE